MQQADTPEDFCRMRELYTLVQTYSPIQILENLIELGNILDPTITSFRVFQASFSSGRTAIAPENISRQITLLSEHINGLTIPIAADAALYIYHRFEDIHPLRDGNGRIGAVLYNALCGTLSDPTFPAESIYWQ